MRLIYVGIFLILVVKINCENVWLKDIISPKGWDLGYGVVLKLNENKKGKNVPISERLSLDLNFGDSVGVSLGKPKSDGVELDFFVKKDIGNPVEGRGKKYNDGGKNAFQMLIGYKAAMMISMAFGVLKLLTMKAIFLAKTALIVALIALLMKLKDYSRPEIIEVEQHVPNHVPYYAEKYSGYGQHGYGGGYYGGQAQSSNLYNDIVYAPSATAESSGVFSAVMPNGSVVPVNTARTNEDVERRRDKPFHRKIKGSLARSNLLSVKKYAASSET